MTGPAVRAPVVWATDELRRVAARRRAAAP